MACGDITTGRLKQCKQYQGGNTNLFLFNYVENPFTVTAGQATAINPLLTAVYKFELTGNGNTFEENLVGARNEGTIVNTQTITTVLKGMDAATSVELNELVKGYPMAVIQDRNGVYHALGIDDGIDFSIVASSGGAKTDMNGYTLTGVAETKDYSPKLDTATITAFLALVA